MNKSLKSGKKSKVIKSQKGQKITKKLKLEGSNKVKKKTIYVVLKLLQASRKKVI